MVYYLAKFLSYSAALTKYNNCTMTSQNKTMKNLEVKVNSKPEQLYVNL